MQPRESPESRGQGAAGWGERVALATQAPWARPPDPLTALDGQATGSPAPLRQMKGSSSALGPLP